MEIELLRLHHRRERDKRVTTHIILSARILGISKVYVEGERDERLFKSIKDVENKWGKSLEMEYIKSWKELMKSYDGLTVHLTMYGLPFQEQIKKIRKEAKDKRILIIVGSEKVEGEVYKLVDHNIAVTHQPHSEITALALFLYELNNRNLKDTFNNAKIQIISSERGKKVIKRGENG